MAIPTHLSLGPVEIPQMYLIGGFEDGGIPIEFSVDLSAALGPLQASVSRMGATADISFPEGGGNAGVAQIDVGFKPPTGVGLSIDAGVVKGGGYLYLDFDTRRVRRRARAGVQRVPDPQGDRHHHHPDARRVGTGFSLLIIITVEFGTGDPARLRLHAARRRRPARPEPHDGAGARSPTACAPGRSRA